MAKNDSLVWGLAIGLSFIVLFTKNPIRDAIGNWSKP
jgi:hypothetical protein